MQFEQFSALAILLGFFRGGEFPFRQRNACLLSHDFHGFGEADILDLLHEGENIAALVAAEAMVELTHRVDREGRGFLPVEGTQAGVVLPSGLLQRDVLADDADNVRLLLYELSEV